MSLPPLIASLSGGKDSTAMALWLREQGIEFRAVFLDTGWEHPITYEYIDELERHLDQPIERVRGPWTFEYLAVYKGCFPGTVLRRWCTDYLKLQPMVRWLAEQYEGAEVVVSAVGVRADESPARAGLPFVEPMRQAMDYVLEWRPLLRWTEQDVIDCHKKHKMTPNPLYLRGARRVGCWPCVKARKTELALLDEDRIARIEQLEAAVAESSRLRGAAHERPPSMFSIKSHGKHRCTPIREIVEWARTSRGGKQCQLVSVEEPGCMRWGLCE